MREDILKLIPTGGTVAELGVAEGTFSYLMLKNTNLGHLYSIDMWAGDRGHDISQYKKTISKLAPYRNRNTIIRLKFEEAVDLFSDNYFDFIYIDGYAHTGQEKGKTLHDWYPKIKPNGVFAGDDYTSRWPETKKTVDNFIKEKNLQLHIIENSTNKSYAKHPSWWVYAIK